MINDFSTCLISIRFFQPTFRGNVGIDEESFFFFNLSTFDSRNVVINDFCGGPIVIRLLYKLFTETSISIRVFLSLIVDEREHK